MTYLLSFRQVLVSYLTYATTFDARTLHTIAVAALVITAIAMPIKTSLGDNFTNNILMTTPFCLVYSSYYIGYALLCQSQR